MRAHHLQQLRLAGCGRGCSHVALTPHLQRCSTLAEPPRAVAVRGAARWYVARGSPPESQSHTCARASHPHVMRAILLLCLLGAAAAAPRARRDATHWLALISEIARLGGAEAGAAPAPVSSSQFSAPVLPPAIRLDGPGGTTTVQLVLVPVPAAPTPAQCTLNAPPAAPHSPALLPPALPSLASAPPVAAAAPAAQVDAVVVRRRPSALAAVPRSEQSYDELDDTPNEVPAVRAPTGSPAPPPPYRRTRGAPYFPPTGLEASAEGPAPTTEAPLSKKKKRRTRYAWGKANSHDRQRRAATKQERDAAKLKKDGGRSTAEQSMDEGDSTVAEPSKEASGSAEEATAARSSPRPAAAALTAALMVREEALPSKVQKRPLNREDSSGANSEGSAVIMPPPKVPASRRDNSALLLQQFLAEAGGDASLPPVVLHEQDGDSSTTLEPAPAPPADPARTARCARACKRRAQWTDETESTPPTPRFERSMTLKGALTVPRARYTERYTVRWDAASGAARTDYHGGAASTYRARVRGGYMQAVMLRTDRAGAAELRRCLALPPRRSRPSERAPPALPAPQDLTAFEFAGYVERAERWRRTVRGARAHGEALVYRHELLLTRAADNITAVPLRYAVSVDSTLLGANCDGYVHYYDEVRFVHHDPATFQLNVADACDHIEATNETHLVEPLREFTLAQRDPRYEDAFQEYKSAHGRAYADELEEAIRKQLIISSERFVSSGNREGATFEMEVNFMGDRLVAERSALFGAKEEALAPGEPFPYSDEKLEGLKGRMLRSFSWVKQGGVSHVRNQYLCQSCWAFAVAGAVEGALFVRTGRLVPLSEQSMVDCGAQFGTHGCNSTWPNFAYEYVKHRGLPALDEYPSYTGKVETCRADAAPAVTRISGHVNVTGDSITALQVALRRQGPVVVLVNTEADSFALHSRGVYSDRKCKRKPSTHAMLAVGWTTARGATHLRLKNSWSEAWGDGGYMWLRGDTDTCGVLRLPSYPVLGAADVLRVPAAAPAGAPAA